MRAILFAALILGCVSNAQADDLSAKVDMIVTGALGPKNDAEKYCRNIADAAKEAKFEWQVKTIAELEDALAKRTTELEAKRAEIEIWLKKREDFMALAQEKLVGIYSKMRADAASAQMIELGEITAAALLMKLQPRISSAILNEMPAADAARLASLMVDSSQEPQP